MWTILAAIGVATFYQNFFELDTKIRAAALSLVFPGAGYIASCNIAGAILFILTWALSPLVLLAVRVPFPKS